MGNSGTVSSGYTEPNSILFIAPMIEWIGTTPTGSAIANVVIEGGSAIEWISPRFTGVGALDKPIFLINQTGTAQTSEMSFSNLITIGDPAHTTVFDIDEVSTLTFSGRNVIVGALVAFKVNGTNVGIKGDLDNSMFNNVATPFTFSGGASMSSTIMYEYTERFFQAKAYGYVQRVQEFGESGVRFYQNTNGSLEWGDGTGYSSDVQLNRATTGLLSVETNQMIRAPGGLITKVKAGTPTDADTVYDTDGTMIVDTSASKLWIRISGTWKSVTLT
jgi:hypothetical protein